MSTGSPNWATRPDKGRQGAGAFKSLVSQSCCRREYLPTCSNRRRPSRKLTPSTRMYGGRFRCQARAYERRWTYACFDCAKCHGRCSRPWPGFSNHPTKRCFVTAHEFSAIQSAKRLSPSWPSFCRKSDWSWHSPSFYWAFDFCDSGTKVGHLLRLESQFWLQRQSRNQLWSFYVFLVNF